MRLPFSRRSVEARMFRLTREPIDIQKTVESIQKPEDGAVVVFDGVVRNHSKDKSVRYLEYDAYESMAIKKLEEVGVRARSRYAIRDIAIVHRLGRLDVGECSVAIVVASAHRGPAFEACRFAIDTIKEIVPIWKKEFYENGEVWIEGGH
jgi:molybdopterin synthase catalytic subunit